VHIGESHRGYLGTGSIEFQPFFSALAASGYSGVITFESFSSRVVSPTLSNTLCVWRDLCDRPTACESAWLWKGQALPSACILLMTIDCSALTLT
jgi:D-psicose/D-tagatose/L-ribulose 3-epimerase